METLLTRNRNIRNITVLLLVIFAQLVLIAVQVRNDQDVRMVRVWSVTAITPLARVLETVRGGTSGFFRNYILMHDARADNRRLQADLDRLKMENQFLKTEIATADRAKALVAFQQRTQSRTIAARVIAAGAGANSKVVFLDRGSGAGVEKGMAVVTPDGIVGKVIAAYPTASEVMLVTDLEFAAGVVSQKNRVVGTLRGQGQSNCRVDYVPSEEKVDVGETFYTSGDDRIFPKGFPVGVARVVRPGSPYQEILVEPAGLEHGLEAVLIVLEGVHQAIPEAPPVNAPVYLGTRPPAEPGEQIVQPSGSVGTDADKLLQKYKQIGAAENHKFGEGGPGAKPPDFNLKIPAPGAAVPAVESAQPLGADAATRRRGDAANPSQPQVHPPAAVKPPGATNPADATKTGVAASPRRPVAESQPPPQ
jgi:rod shape-determining protein MreC